VLAVVTKGLKGHDGPAGSPRVSGEIPSANFWASSWRLFTKLIRKGFDRRIRNCLRLIFFVSFAPHQPSV